jgi:hypothetical protein
MTVGERVFLVGLAAGLIAAFVIWPIACGFMIAIGVVALIAQIIVNTTVRKLMSMLMGDPLADQWCRWTEERKNEDIGTFARAFDRRSEPFDPWVVRATWDALRTDLVVPLRPTDRIWKDLPSLDTDDFDLYDLIVEVAARSGHSLEGLKANRYYAMVCESGDATIGDIVKLISSQPRIE